jgi:hypothetical protein
MRTREITFVAQKFRESEIRDERPRFCVKQNVSRLQVAVQNAAFMSEVRRIRQGCDEFGDLAPSARERRHSRREAAPGCQLHGEPRQLLVVAGFVNRKNRRMVELRQGAHLELKPLAEFRLRGGERE